MIEFMNNVWSFFITSSDFNTKIFTLFFCFIETYINMMLFLTILNIDSDKKSRVLYVSILSILGIINGLFIPNPFNVFINFILPFIYIIYGRIQMMKKFLIQHFLYIIYIKKIIKYLI